MGGVNKKMGGVKKFRLLNMKGNFATPFITPPIFFSCRLRFHLSGLESPLAKSGRTQKRITQAVAEAGLPRRPEFPARGIHAGLHARILASQTEQIMQEGNRSLQVKKLLSACLPLSLISCSSNSTTLRANLGTPRATLFSACCGVPGGPT